VSHPSIGRGQAAVAEVDKRLKHVFIPITVELLGAIDGDSYLTLTRELGGAIHHPIIPLCDGRRAIFEQ